MKVVISAVKGAGKTTTIKFITEKRNDIEVVRVGDYFEKYYKEKGLKRDEGDKGVSREEHARIQEEIFDQIAKKIKDYRHVIIDTNLFFSKSEGYFPGLPYNVLTKINPDVIVVMEYRPEDILERRKKDIQKLGRERSASLTIEGIRKEQEIQRMYAFAYSALTGCAVKILERYEPEKFEFQHNKLNAKEILKLFVE